MRLLELYFNHCHDLFTKAQKQHGADSDFYFQLAEKLIVKVSFAGIGSSLPFRRALAHLEVVQTDSADLSICVWDSTDHPESTPPYPSWEREEHFAGQTFVNSGSVRVACEIMPNRLSMLDSERNLGLFWIQDVSAFPWFEQCRPLRNVIQWWALKHQLYLVHAACVGSADSGILVIGNAGSGKSTTALSSLTNKELDYCADDLCLIGLERGQAVAYSLYNTGKLEAFDQLPELEQYVWNPFRSENEKAVIFVRESFPQKMMNKAHISAIVLPSVTGRLNSELESVSNGELVRTLVKSSAVEMIGAGPADFLGVIRVCSRVPSYKLHAGTDFAKLNGLLNTIPSVTQPVLAGY